MIAFSQQISQSFGDTFKTICTELHAYRYECYDRKYSRFDWIHFIYDTSTFIENDENWENIKFIVGCVDGFR